MKKMVLLFCFLSIVAGVACTAESGEKLVAISADKIAENPRILPGEGYVTSGQPSEAVLSSFAKAGYSTIIDMRMPEEDRGMDESSVVSGLGMTYITLPIGSAEDISFENAAVLDEILSGLEQPVLIHCASGNRVGALFALRAKANGASSEDAFATGKAAGVTSLEKVVRERLELE